MQVSEVMTHGVECVRPEDSIALAAERMRQLNVGSLPVCAGNGQLMGMITDRDITVRAIAESCDPNDTYVGGVMTAHVISCYEDQDVEEAARLMKANQIRRLVVLDYDRRLVGIVSLGDLAVDTGDERLAAGALEAISAPAEPRR
jgi:CBS domain-containing protein